MNTLMSRSVTALLAGVTLAAAQSAQADEGAFTVDAGGGGMAVLLPTPVAALPSFQLGAAPEARGGVRYALTHSLELTATGYWQPPVRFLHSNVSLNTSAGALEGALQHEMSRYGAAVGARYVTGFQWRFFAGLDLGWSRRSYSALHAYDTRVPGVAVEYPVQLADFAIDSVTLGLSAGIEWRVTDRLSVSVAPRVDALLGRQAAFPVTFPVFASWNWML